MTKHTISNQLEQARVVLGVMTNDTAVREQLAIIGYDDAAIAEGQALYDAAVQARQSSHDVRGTRLGMTDSVKRTRQALHKSLTDLGQLLLIEYRNERDIQERLALRPARRNTGDAARPVLSRHRIARGQAALIVQARTFYSTVLNDPTILQTAARFGYTTQRLQTEQALISQLENLDTQQEILIAEAKARVRQQNQSLKTLNAWIQRVRSLARVALRHRPDLLDKLRA